MNVHQPTALVYQGGQYMDTLISPLRSSWRRASKRYRNKLSAEGRRAPQQRLYQLAHRIREDITDRPTFIPLPHLLNAASHPSRRDYSEAWADLHRIRTQLYQRGPFPQLAEEAHALQEALDHPHDTDAVEIYMGTARLLFMMGAPRVYLPDLETQAKALALFHYTRHQFPEMVEVLINHANLCRISSQSRHARTLSNQAMDVLNLKCSADHHPRIHLLRHKTAELHFKLALEQAAFAAAEHHLTQLKSLTEKIGTPASRYETARSALLYITQSRNWFPLDRCLDEMRTAFAALLYRSPHTRLCALGMEITTLFAVAYPPSERVVLQASIP
jgi:hypothetical protein